MPKKPSTYQGLQKNIRTEKVPSIDIWENQYSDKKYIINFCIPEFTCICPKTGLPDFATLYINYSPRKNCLELKSLKEYINSYRNLGIFHEHVVNKILEDIVKSAKPRWAEIIGEFNVRGGIKTTVSASYGTKPKI